MNKFMKPTPGPWVVWQSTFKGDEHISVTSLKNKIIALTGYKNADDEAESIANAALISIAPDMLEALIAIQEAARLDILDPESINHLISNVLGKLANEAGIQ